VAKNEQLSAGGIEHVAYFLLQYFRGKGLGKKGHALLGQDLRQHSVIHIARHEEHFHAGIPTVKLLSELAPAEMRHNDIRQQEIDRALMTSGQRERVLPMCGFEHAIAVETKHLMNNAAHDGIVFDE